jgi:hypothetical protein
MLMENEKKGVSRLQGEGWLEGRAGWRRKKKGKGEVGEKKFVDCQLAVMGGRERWW